MKKITIIFCLLSFGLLTACGVKGPLYYPEQKTEITQ